MPYQMEKEDRADGIRLAHSRATTDDGERLHKAECRAQGLSSRLFFITRKEAGEEGWVELCLGRRLGRSPCAFLELSAELSLVNEVALGVEKILAQHKGMVGCLRMRRDEGEEASKGRQSAGAGTAMSVSGVFAGSVSSVAVCSVA